MKYTLYQVDAFTGKLFGGNPAAVIPLGNWISGELMQQVALENNLSETVFFVPSQHKDADYDIRWFTPEVEINLCGHATLAAAFVLFSELGEKDTITFSSKSGLLKVCNRNGLIEMDFPSWKPERTGDYPETLSEILGGVEIVGVYKHRDLLVELMDENAVRRCVPDPGLLAKHVDKLIITAPASVDSRAVGIDFVSRFFAPGAGIFEDPVTGSAHSQLIPFWSEKLGKKKMLAHQVSKRGGEIWCEQLNAERVTMSGKAVLYLKGEIMVP